MMKLASLQPRIAFATRDERGFTLIELLVTVTVIGILAAVVSVGVGGASTAAQTKANVGTFNQVQAALDSYTAANQTALTVTSCDADGAGPGLVKTAACLGTFYDRTGASVTDAALGDYSFDVASSALVTASPAWLRLYNTNSLTCIVSTATSTTITQCK